MVAAMWSRPIPSRTAAEFLGFFRLLPAVRDLSPAQSRCADLSEPCSEEPSARPAPPPSPGRCRSRAAPQSRFTAGPCQAFNLAASNLLASGGFYSTRPSELFGYAARTVSGTRSISYHAFGAAVDINSRTNPLASTLITDFPEWYVDAWRAAGFCWGGDWVADKKDAMHFSWMGPSATPGYGAVPSPYPSLAPRAGFTETVAVPSTALGSRVGGATDALADLTGDGALDTVRVRTHPVAGPTLEITGSWADFGMCGFSRFQLTGAPTNHRVLFGNINFGGRPDLVFLDLSGSQAGLLIYEANGFYQKTRSFNSGASADSNATYLLADFNSDGRGDLYKVSGQNLEIWDAASNYATRINQVDASCRKRSGADCGP